MTPSAAVTAADDAWQDALAAEHQACFGYSLLGPRLSGRAQQLAIGCSDAHLTLRDTTSGDLAAAGVVPVEPLADYPALYPVRDAAAARALAVRLEDDCATAWRYLYVEAASTGLAASNAARAGALRAAAQEALSASAVRATRWRLLGTPVQATTPFPGIG